MSALAKEAYYASAGMKRGLAARYFRMFEGAETLLDVGCGVGGLGEYAPQDLTVFGVDSDPGALARASQSEAVTAVDLDRDPLPYDDATFDAVLAKDILEHVQNPLRLVREIERVLRPGGIVVASVIMAVPRLVWSDYTHVRGFTAASVRLLFEDAGLKVKDVWRMGGVPLSDRLHFVDLVPTILRFPPAARLWASSWELLARRPGE